MYCWPPGGYAANPTMIEALQPNVPRCVTANSYSLMCDGSGIKTALWAGATMDEVPCPMIFNRGAVDVGVDAGYIGSGEDAIFPGTIVQLNMGSQPFMAVNRNGVRFTNESLPYDNICNASALQPGGVFCQVFDGNAPADIDRFAQAGCARLTTDRIRKGASVDELCAAALEPGIMKKADTLEELADMLGFAGEAKQNFLAQVGTATTSCSMLKLMRTLARRPTVSPPFARRPSTDAGTAARCSPPSTA